MLLWTYCELVERGVKIVRKKNSLRFGFDQKFILLEIFNFSCLINDWSIVFVRWLKYISKKYSCEK